MNILDEIIQNKRIEIEQPYLGLDVQPQLEDRQENCPRARQDMGPPVTQLPC